jgi:hypothetical protein
MTDGDAPPAASASRAWAPAPKEAVAAAAVKLAKSCRRVIEQKWLMAISLGRHCFAYTEGNRQSAGVTDDELFCTSPIDRGLAPPPRWHSPRILAQKARRLRLQF